MAVVGHEDTNKTTESLLHMSAPPIYLILNHPLLMHRRGRVLSSFPKLHPQ